MWHIGETGEVSWVGDVKEGDHLVDRGLADNIKMDLQFVGCGGRHRLHWAGSG